MWRASSSAVIARSAPPSAISGSADVPGAVAGEATDRLGDDLVDVLRAIDGDDVGLVDLGRLERAELARHHVGAHVVAGALERPVASGRGVEFEEHESDVTGVAEQIAVPAGQRRAGDDDVARAAQLLADACQPGPAVVVGQRLTRRHLDDVGRWVQRVGVDEHGSDGAGDGLADRRLARAGDAHDDDSTVRGHGVGRSIGSQPRSASSDGPRRPSGCASQASMFITADVVDPELAEPYVDIDEQRTTNDPETHRTVSYRYVHGGFAGTNARFSMYFPSVDDYQGRFFQHTYPTLAEEEAAPGTIVFAISNGAYAVSANNAGGVAVAPVIGGYRVNAAAAKFSRQVARDMYGPDAPIRGYLYGASGGAYQTIGGLENTSGVWDGGVPMVPGSPNSIPSYQGAVMLGLRVLHDALPAIADALEPGGNGDPYSGLDDEQRSTLSEVTAIGFPPRGWWQHATLDGGSFWAVAASPRIADPTYVDDFWSVDGYEGADPSSSVRSARIRFDATVAAVGPDTVTLSTAPAGDVFAADLVVTSGAAAGATVPFVDVMGTDVTFRTGTDLGAIAALAPGDEVRLDNSWFLALQYYHRHQVPAGDLYGWDQFRDPSGEPIPPQRPMLLGPLLARVSGGAPTGTFHGKMIMLASTMDVEAYPWSADWYRRQAELVLSDRFDDNFRLWFMDHCDHNPTVRTVPAEAHVVGYEGEMQQALLDLDSWVASGAEPPDTSAYQVTTDNQIELSTSADVRGGVQPIVSLTVGRPGRSRRRSRRIAWPSPSASANRSTSRRRPRFLPGRA